MDENVFRDISYGMYVVTTKTDRLVGCFINTMIQVTSNTKVIAISLNKNNFTNSSIRERKSFAVSVLKENASDRVISLFGYFSSRERDKFADVKYEEIRDLPIVTEDMCSYLICDLVEVIDCGSHDLFIGKVVEAKKLSDDSPMTYRYYHEVLKGKSPKNAPTFIEAKEETSEKKNLSGKRYQCVICGYIYDDNVEKIPFSSLPGDWVCPRCGVGKEQFQEIDA